ncbi:MAG: NifB/NifX family molybdenum-iron cluster-binding protein [Candidatus Izemoplasmatales bacterium]
MNKIAIAVSEEGQTAHFGHCYQFVVYSVEEGKITNKETILNPEHQRGFLPKFLYDHGIRTVIASNLGAMALQILNGLKMEVVFGVNGNEDDVMANYLAGTLKANPEACNHHEHHHHDHDHDHHHHDHDHHHGDHKKHHHES